MDIELRARQKRSVEVSVAADESRHHYAAGSVDNLVSVPVLCDFIGLSDSSELAIFYDYRVVGEYSMIRIYGDDYAVFHQDRRHAQAS